MQSLIGSERKRLLLQQQQQQQQQVVLVGGAGPSAVSQRPFDDIERLGHKHKVASRIFVTEIRASPLLLAANPENGVALIATEHSAKYRPHRSPTGSERMGDPSRAYVLHGKVVWARNGFPFTVMVKSNYIRGRFYGPNDQRGYFAVPPDTTLSYPEGFDVLRPVQEYNSKIFKDFGHCTTESYKKGVSKSKGGAEYMVLEGVVIHDILVRNQTTCDPPYDLNSPEFLDSVNREGRKVYKIPSGMYKAAKKCFHDSVLPKLPHVNLMQMFVGIERLGSPQWDAPLGTFYYGTTECADESVLSQQYSFSIAQWFRYRLIYEGNHD